MKFRHIHSLHYMFIFSLALTVLACSREPSTAEAIEEHHAELENIVELTEAQFRNAGISLSAVEQKQISGTIQVSGVLDVPPQQLVSISAPMGGFLKDTELLQGSRVKKGQVVGRIENLDFIQVQQDYLDAKGQFELAKTEYERQQDLSQQNINSTKVVQQAKANFTSWQARYNGLGEKLKVLGISASSLEAGTLKSSINLYSPISGYVTQVNVNIGKYVNPTDVLFEIVDTEHLHAELIVFEKDVRKLRIGQKVRFTLANETTERMATVYLIGREISTERTIQIHCHIDVEDKELLPGMYLNAAVETGGAQVPALPDQAIIDFQGRKYIFVQSEPATPASGDNKPGNGELASVYHFTMVEIQIGNHELGYTEVILPQHLKAGSRIVVAGGYSLLSEMKNSEDEDGHH